jgi:hypothetical protein
MEGLIEGRIVHFVLNNGEHRPAILVKVWESLRSEGTVNMIVFLDGINETGIIRGHLDTTFTAWRTSVHYSEGQEPGTWHWIERA